MNWQHLTVICKVISPHQGQIPCDMKKIKNSCPQKTYTSNWALTRHLCFNQHGCEVRVGGSRGQSHVGGAGEPRSACRTAKARLKCCSLSQARQAGIVIASINDFLNFRKLTGGSC